MTLFFAFQLVIKPSCEHILLVIGIGGVDLYESKAVVDPLVLVVQFSGSPITLWVITGYAPLQLVQIKHAQLAAPQRIILLPLTYLAVFKTKLKGFVHVSAAIPIIFYY